MEGLEFLHRCGIIHRDVKPSNILAKIKEDGNLDIKLIDFSISKVISDHSVDVLNDLFTRGILDLDSNRLTKNVTTRPYRAPEVALMTPYDSKIDLWGVGCVLGELLLSRQSGNRVILFPSVTCQPLSPINSRLFGPKYLPKEYYLMNCPDLLVLHCNFFSCLCFDHLENRQQRDYLIKLRSLPYAYTSPKLKEVIDIAPSSLGSLLKGLLVFNPKDRLSAAAALKALGTHPMTESSMKVDSSIVKTVRNIGECYAAILREGFGIRETLPPTATKPRVIRNQVQSNPTEKARLLR